MPTQHNKWLVMQRKLSMDCYNWNIATYIFVEMRQRGRFAGFSLYISNTGDKESSSLCYKDGPELPPLYFTTTCMLSGRYVLFYNERLDGVTYPSGYEVSANVYMELCEVIVYGNVFCCFLKFFLFCSLVFGFCLFVFFCKLTITIIITCTSTLNNTLQ